MTLIRSFYLRTLAVLRVAWRRLVAERGLALATAAGLVVAIALILSIPMYAEGIYYRVLSEGLFSDTPSFRGKAIRPPVALLFRYVGSFKGPVELGAVIPLEGFFDKEAYDYLHLPASPDAARARIYNTGLFNFLPEKELEQITTAIPEYQVGLAVISPAEAHVRLLDGRLPAASTNLTADAPVEVAVSRTIAERMGIQPGESYLAYDFRAQRRYEDAPTLFRLTVVGVWEPLDTRAELWDYTQLGSDMLLLVSEEAYAQQISPRLSDEIYQALWYLPLDASRIYVEDVDPLLQRITFLAQGVDRFLPGTTLDVSPVSVLEKYQSAANILAVLLYLFSIPIVSLVITFVALVVALAVERQRNQTAVLRSRGATTAQVVGMSAMEGLVLSGLSLAAAIPLGMVLAYAIGQTRTFLDFSLASNLRVGVSWTTVQIGLAAIGLTLAAQVLPTFGAAQHTLITYKQERARSMRPPWWQRAWLDVLILIPALYGMYVLRQQGGLWQSEEALASQPFQNPLLFLVPALLMLAITLMIVRVLPYVMRTLAWLGARTRGIGFVMAARQLARNAGVYAAPLGLLILTLGLSTYTASLAATLDGHLYDQQRYYVGADMSLIDAGEELGASSVSPGSMASSVSSSELRWQFLPVSEYLKISGVELATRVGRYPGLAQTPNGFLPGVILGVDRVDFAQVAFWRDDFADESLGGLMNLLAAQRDGVLLPEEFMRQNLINLGDQISIVAKAYGESATIPVQVVGQFSYFPSWYPDEGPLMVANLEYVFEQCQTQYPYRVWLQTTAGTDYERLSDEIRGMNLGAGGMIIAEQKIQTEQQDPERQGLLGLLSVGFSAAAILSALGFVLYALFSYQRRAVELGVLRAIGLARRDLTGYVMWELAFLILAGVGTGTMLGIWASHAFVPYLQIGADISSRIPPFEVQIAWPALLRLYAFFGALFAAAIAVLIRLLIRMRLAQAIKMGETT